MMHRPNGVPVKVTPKALAAAGVLVLAIATYVAWLATSMLFDGRQMTALCGTSMTNAGIAQVCIGLLMAGVLLFAGFTMIVAARRSRRRRDSEKTAA